MTPVRSASPIETSQKNVLPYRSMTGEELIKEILSGYRRIATTILLLAGTQVTSSIGTVAVDP